MKTNRKNKKIKWKHRYHIEFTELNKIIKKKILMEKRSHNTKIIQNTDDNNKSIKRTFKNISFEQNQIISLKDKGENILHGRRKISNALKKKVRHRTRKGFVHSTEPKKVSNSFQFSQPS